MKTRPTRKLRFLPVGRGYELQSFNDGKWLTLIVYRSMSEAASAVEAERLRARGFVVVEN